MIDAVRRFNRLRGNGWRQTTSPLHARAIVARRAVECEGDRAGWADLPCVLCTETVLLRMTTLAACDGEEAPPVWCVQCALNMVRRR